MVSKRKPLSKVMTNQPFTTGQTNRDEPKHRRKTTKNRKSFKISTESQDRIKSSSDIMLEQDRGTAHTISPDQRNNNLYSNVYNERNNAYEPKTMLRQSVEDDKPSNGLISNA